MLNKSKVEMTACSAGPGEVAELIGLNEKKSLVVTALESIHMVPTTVDANARK